MLTGGRLGTSSGKRSHKMSAHKYYFGERAISSQSCQRDKLCEGLFNLTHFTTAKNRVVGRRLAQTFAKSRREVIFGAMPPENLRRTLPTFIHIYDI